MSKRRAKELPANTINGQTMKNLGKFLLVPGKML